jgi:hypothetical protein
MGDEDEECREGHGEGYGEVMEMGGVASVTLMMMRARGFTKSWRHAHSFLAIL